MPIEADKLEGNLVAIIIAIEDYRPGKSGSINSVKYARNDAERFKTVLVDYFNLKEENLLMLIDQNAIKAGFEDDVRYWIKQLSSEDRFVFYYAGHGFFKDGDNKLTCWDTHPDNLEETCASLKEILFDPLLESECKQSLIFLDCCADSLKADHRSRDVMADLDTLQFEEFTNLSNYHAVFMSCSPNEKSHSNDVLKHGIWTWHLTEALSGKIPEAIIKEEYITAQSLQNFLSHAVPKFITKKTTIRKTQKPYSKIHASNDFQIRKIPTEVIEIDHSLPDIKLNYARAIFRKIDYEQIKRAKGFKKGNSIPKWYNRNAILFTQKAFEPEVEEEIQEVYLQTKKILNLRKSDIDYGSGEEGGSVECGFFRFNLRVELDEENLNHAKLTRTLELRVSRKYLPENFDSIFNFYLDELIIPIEGDLDFDDIVAKFENLAKLHGGNVRDNGKEEIVEYITERNTSITVNALQNELVITHYSPTRSLDLLDKSIEDLKMISSHQIKLIASS